MNFTQMKNEVLRFEGLSLKPYFCPAGKLTIGVGRNLEDNGITQQEAMQMLQNDLERCWQELQDNISFLMQLPQEAREILLHMCYNLGIHKLLGFKRALAHLQQGNFELAAQEMLDSRWAKQVGNRAEVLATRMGRLQGYHLQVKELLVEMQGQLSQLERQIGHSFAKLS